MDEPVAWAIPGKGAVRRGGSGGHWAGADSERLTSHIRRRGRRRDTQRWTKMGQVGSSADGMEEWLVPYDGHELERWWRIVRTAQHQDSGDVSTDSHMAIRRASTHAKPSQYTNLSCLLSNSAPSFQQRAHETESYRSGQPLNACSPDKTHEPSERHSCPADVSASHPADAAHLGAAEH